MTRRDFFQTEKTWKSAALRLACAGGKRAVPYRTFTMHQMVNAKTMFVKSALMQMRHRA